MKKEKKAEYLNAGFYVSAFLKHLRSITFFTKIKVAPARQRRHVLTPGAIGDSRGEDHWRLCESDRSEALHDVKPGLAVERDGRTGPAFPPLFRLQIHVSVR